MSLYFNAGLMPTPSQEYVTWIDEILSNVVGGNSRASPRASVFRGGIRIPTPSRSFVVEPPLRSFFLLSRAVASLSQKRCHRGHVRRLPEVHRRRTSAPASPTRSVCAPSAAAKFSPLREPA